MEGGYAPLFFVVDGGLQGIELPRGKTAKQGRVLGVVPPRLFKQHRSYTALQEGGAVVNGQILITSRTLSVILLSLTHTQQFLPE